MYRLLPYLLDGEKGQNQLRRMLLLPDSSFFIIKHDAYKYKERILSYVLTNALSILEAYEVILPFEFLKVLYTDDTSEFNEVAAKYDSNKICVVGIASGVDCAKKLNEICGNDKCSFACEEGTIRHDFEVGEHVMIDGIPHERNAFYCSNPKDVAMDLQLFYDYLDNEMFVHIEKII